MSTLVQLVSLSIGDVIQVTDAKNPKYGALAIVTKIGDNFIIAKTPAGRHRSITMTLLYGEFAYVGEAPLVYTE